MVNAAYDGYGERKDSKGLKVKHATFFFLICEEKIC